MPAAPGAAPRAGAESAALAKRPTLREWAAELRLVDVLRRGLSSAAGVVAIYGLPRETAGSAMSDAARDRPTPRA